MANLALGRRIVDNLLEFTNNWFSVIAFKVVNIRIRAMCKARNIRNMLE